ncbi:MAG TPA: hypothetical protein VI895_05320 [Bdellovibrionota bacterium]|nr:hypothetical protein [Bdellovibrionota bacterium]
MDSKRGLKAFVPGFKERTTARNRSERLFERNRIRNLCSDFQIPSPWEVPLVLQYELNVVTTREVILN